MIEVLSKPLDQSIQVGRYIGTLEGNPDGPTVIFIGGIHGNEASGVFALHHAFAELKKSKAPINGRVFALSGNLKALANGQRFIDEDLNRIWTPSNLNQNGSSKTCSTSEEEELRELLRCTRQILENEKPPFYFIDLHTTSGETLPFITLNDTLINRKFCDGFPLPVILGIEEFIEGPYLNYINDLGYVALGFESGQHDDISSVENHISFVYLTLVRSGVLKKEHCPNFTKHHQALNQKLRFSDAFYEIIERYSIEKETDFAMDSGYINFQSIRKNQKLARHKGRIVQSKYNGRIFLPLYQKQGQDGFFIVRKIPNLALVLSTILRKMKFDSFLVLLPGISWASKQKNILKVDLKVARFLARPFLHLLGYRTKRMNGAHLTFYSRERNFKYMHYRGQKWARLH
jgi:hypothetical protein